MACGDFLWQTFLFVTCLFSMIAITNILSIFPINLHEFDTLPLEAQNDITSQVRFRLSEYRKRLALYDLKDPDRDLMLHLNPQICYKGEKAPDGTGPWPEEMTQYFCASKDLTEWCLKYYRLYQSTEKVYPLSNGKEVHVSLTCYRIRLYNRYMDDINIPVCVTAIVMASCVFHSWWLSFRRQRGDFGEDIAESPVPSPPPPPPPKKKGPARNPSAPLRNLRSRHENFRNRRS